MATVKLHPTRPKCVVVEHAGDGEREIVASQRPETLIDVPAAINEIRNAAAIYDHAGDPSLCLPGNVGYEPADLANARACLERALRLLEGAAHVPFLPHSFGA